MPADESLVQDASPRAHREDEEAMEATFAELANPPDRWPAKTALFAGFGRLLFRLPGAFRRLDDQTHLDGLGGHLDPADRAVDDGPNALDVGLELPLRHAGRLDTDPAQVLGLTATSDRTPGTRFLAREITLSRRF